MYPNVSLQTTSGPQPISVRDEQIADFYASIPTGSLLQQNTSQPSSIPMSSLVQQNPPLVSTIPTSTVIQQITPIPVSLPAGVVLQQDTPTSTMLKPNVPLTTSYQPLATGQLQPDTSTAVNFPASIRATTTTLNFSLELQKQWPDAVMSFDWLLCIEYIS